MERDTEKKTELAVLEQAKTSRVEAFSSEPMDKLMDVLELQFQAYKMLKSCLTEARNSINGIAYSMSVEQIEEQLTECLSYCVLLRDYLENELKKDDPKPTPICEPRSKPIRKNLSSDKLEYKLFNMSRRFCKEYAKKKAESAYDSLPLWKKADVLLTRAAVINSKLCDTRLASLKKYLPFLKPEGEKLFTEAMGISASLNEEESKMLWEAQKRNKGVTKFEDLVTKAMERNASVLEREMKELKIQ